MSTRPHVEYLLIGSGVAASTLAVRLLEHNPGTSIMMLESGALIPAKDRRLWWDYIATNTLPYQYTYDLDADNESTGNTFWELNQTRVTAYGGTTLHWGGWSLRMKPEDFHLYSNTGEGGDWLVDYNDLEPYYCLAEKHLSVCGDSSDGWVKRSQPYPLTPYPYQQADMEIIEALHSNGLKVGKMPLARYRHCMTTGTCRYCPFGARFNAQYINEDLESRFPGNLKILTNATVTEILLDSKKKAAGVRYLCLQDGAGQKKNEHYDVHADKVIVCAGAYESPKLLMGSGQKYYANGIGNDQDLVGRYLVSHSFLAINGTSAFNDQKSVNELGFPTFITRSWDDESHQQGGKVSMFRNQNYPGQNWAMLMQAGKTREQINAIATGPRQNVLSAFFEEKGKFDNTLKPLAGKKDRFGRPQTSTHFSRSEQDLRNANIRLAEMSSLFSSIPAYRVTDSSLGGAAGFHASGTCRMGRTPEDGVTDGNLKVHGMDNLYICSNAVFPSVGAVNPTLTLTALAYRLGDHLAGKDLLAPFDPERGG